MIPPCLSFFFLQGALNQIGRVFIMLDDAGLKPNLGSYCHALECMGRNPDCSPNTVIRCVNSRGSGIDSNKDKIWLKIINAS